MSRLHVLAVLALTFGFAGATHAQTTPEKSGFGVIRGPSFLQARTQALEWLKGANPNHAILKQAEDLWKPDTDRTLIDRVADTLALGDKDAAAFITQINDPNTAAPTEVPALLKDTNKAVFVRANLALYFARQMTQRRVHDEALAALLGTRPEQVIDPASYYFFKAVAEDKLLMKRDGLQSVERLLTSVADVPERYSVVAKLMKEEMSKWDDKDLGDVARRMEEVEGRLDVARGGPKTQQKEKEILDRLKKEIENIEQQIQQMQQQQQAQGRQPQDPRSTDPLKESKFAGGAGPGNVERKKLLKDLEVWGRMPEKERIKALEAISREYPPHFREAIEGYLKELAKSSGKK